MKKITKKILSCSFEFDSSVFNKVSPTAKDLIKKCLTYDKNKYRGLYKRYQLLLKENCNVTILHSKTTREDMYNYVANADIIVIAIGKCGFLDHSFKYKSSAVIVDVGINRIDGKLHGDAVRDLPVKFQTPVPNGVGLLTRLTLLTNLLEAYHNQVK